MEIMDSQKIKFHIRQRIAFQTTTLFFLALISIFLVVPLFSDGQNNQLKKSKNGSGEGIVIIAGKQATHEELRKLIPLSIKQVNIITDNQLLVNYGKNPNDRVVEITLLKEGEKREPMQIRINGQKSDENTDQPKPLLIFGGYIIGDQNPNNINSGAIKSLDVVVGDSAIAKYGEKAVNGVILADLKPDSVFGEYESMPEFPGGVTALRTLVKNTAKYPEAALKDSPSGKVYVNFVISKTGKVEKVRIARGIHPILDAEAIKVVSLMPYWKPGEQYFRGKFGSIKISVSYTIPVEFKLPLQK